MTDARRQLALQQLQQLEAHQRIVVMHPSYSQQRRLLYSCLKEQGCLYLRLDGSALDREILNEYLLPLQMPDKNLADIRLVVLDEWDRVPPAQLEAFLADMLASMDARIILFGRGVPEFTYQEFALRQAVIFLPTDPDQMLLDYNQFRGKSVLVEVQALGRSAVTINGRPIVEWGGDLSRALFFFLIDHGMVRRADIFRAFWPELKTAEATNVFHVTKRKLNDILGIELTTYWSGFYRLSSQIDLVYDAEVFSQMVLEGIAAPNDEGENLLTRAIECYHGNYLVSIDPLMPWIGERRQELSKIHGEALIALARLVEQFGDTPKALGYYTRAFATNPQREDIAASIMKIYGELRLYPDALAVYQRLQDELMNELNISPTQRLQGLAAEIRAKADERQYAPE